MAPILKEKIDKDLSEALKAKDEVRLGTLRMISSAIHNREIEKRGKSGSGELTEDEVLDVVAREAKKRKEAAAIYAKGGRSELEAKELLELKIIDAYLPARLSEEEVSSIVSQVFEAVNPAGEPVSPERERGEKDFGRLMREVMKRAGGRADSALASRLIKERLSK